MALEKLPYHLAREETDRMKNGREIEVGEASHFDCSDARRVVVAF